MIDVISTEKGLLDFYRASQKKVLLRAIGAQLFTMIFFGVLAYFTKETVLYSIGILGVVIIEIINRSYYKKAFARVATLEKAIPAQWEGILEKHSVFFRKLDASKRRLFLRRAQLFLSEKKVEGIDTDVDDLVRLLVAASAIIPTFAFPAFDYPELREVLIYPKSFSKEFEIDGAHKHEENIEGMVGNRYMNRSLLLSKPALLADFDGEVGDENVGIHEFVHLLDREDGDTDGVPEVLAQRNYVMPWLHLIKVEMDRIKTGKSRINPYALTNNAEFLAVVSEYFFSNPEEFNEKHPELYQYLSEFYHQRL